MKNYIPELLEMTKEQLGGIKLQLFVAVAFKLSYNNTDAQYLVANQKLYNWFNKQIVQLENEFIESVSNGRIARQTKYELFVLYTLRIEKVKKLFPRLILNEIRKKNGVSKHDYSKIPLN